MKSKTLMKSKTVFLIMMFVAAGSLLSAQGLKVEPGTCIKVESGAILDISIGDLFLKSDATGDATIIALGSVTMGTGNAIVQRYMPGADSAWHMISSPVNGMAITGSDWDPGDYEDLFLWSEPSPGTTVSFKNTTISPTFNETNPGDNFVTGRGYIAVYYSLNPTNNFVSGSLNQGDINITLAKSTAKRWDWSGGWNLIGNPYPSGLDWSAVTKDNIVTESSAQIYDPNRDGGEGYVIISGTIAPGQGFFVQAVSNNAILALHPSQQVHTTGQSFLKQQASEDKLVLRITSGEYYDETKILIHEASSHEHDFHDATKLYSFNPQVPHLCSQITSGRGLAIHSIPAISETMTIPLSIKVQGNSIMSISMTEIAGVFEEQTIYLHDLLTNTITKLSEIPTYNFIANSNDNPDRFLLKFGVLDINEFPDNNLLNAYVNNNLLYIDNPDAIVAQVEVYNIVGQPILSKEIGQGLQSIPLNVAPGTYIVMMRTDMAIATRKIFIH